MIDRACFVEFNEITTAQRRPETVLRERFAEMRRWSSAPFLTVCRPSAREEAHPAAPAAYGRRCRFVAAAEYAFGGRARCFHAALGHGQANALEGALEAAPFVVVIYATSRLARDRLLAALFERELQRYGVEIYDSYGAGDPTTAGGSLFSGMQQLWDESERTKLSRETRRRMREISEQGYRAGGRAAYGYRRVLVEMPDSHQGDRAKHA